MKTGTLRCCLPWWLIVCIRNLRYQLTISKYIIDQRILEQDWTRGTPGHTQPKVVLSHPSSPPWCLSHCKNSKIMINSLQRLCWLKDLAIWFYERHTRPHATNKGSLICMLPSLDEHLHVKNPRYQLIPSSDTDKKNPAMSLGERHNWLHPTKKDSFTCYLPFKINSMQKN